MGSSRQGHVDRVFVRAVLTVDSYADSDPTLGGQKFGVEDRNLMGMHINFLTEAWKA